MVMFSVFAISCFHCFGISSIVFVSAGCVCLIALIVVEEDFEGWESYVLISTKFRLCVQRVVVFLL